MAWPRQPACEKWRLKAANISEKPAKHGENWRLMPTQRANESMKMASIVAVAALISRIKSEKRRQQLSHQRNGSISEKQPARR
jgi:hypothetical protein